MAANKKRKLGKTFYFSVEGETEKWYLDWLQKTINETLETGNITIKSKVEKDPRQFVKSFSNISAVTITHLYDYEGDSPEQVKTFKATMDHMKEAEGMKSIKYQMGHSNLTFDLWMILHKQNCNVVYTHQSQYLTSINHAYRETFSSMDAYKEEKNFKHLLDKLTLQNVIDAIDRAKIMEGNHAGAGHRPQHHRTFTYYKENPSLSIHERIEELLKDTGIL